MQWRGHGWVWVGLNPPTFFQGRSWDLCKYDENFFLQGGVPRFLSSFCRTTTTLVVHPSQQYRIRLWAKLLQLTDRRIWMIVWILVAEFKFKLQHISIMLTSDHGVMMMTLKWRHIIVTQTQLQLSGCSANWNWWNLHCVPYQPMVECNSDYVERDIVDGIGFGQLVSEFALKV